MMLGRGGEATRHAAFAASPAPAPRPLACAGRPRHLRRISSGRRNSAAYAVFRTDWNAVKRINVIKDLGTRRPPADPRALNILVIGSDSRGGANKTFGAEVAGQRSDTVMVMHIAPGARSVVCSASRATPSCRSWPALRKQARRAKSRSPPETSSNSMPPSLTAALDACGKPSSDNRHPHQRLHRTHLHRVRAPHQ